jgi:glucose-1-phosphate thymidylyltransferase
MKGLILAGGYGRRLRPLIYSGAKQLLQVANKPIIFYGIESLVRTGIKELGLDDE